MAAVQRLKRPAPRTELDDERPQAHVKRPKLEIPPVKHALLERYYPNISTLRHYLISRLPSSSRLRRKKIANLGAPARPSSVENDVLQQQLVHLLDSTLVCFQGDHSAASKADDGRWEKWMSFSQKADDSHVTLSGGLEDALYSQAEIVEFVVWLLFSRAGTGSTWIKHLLCDGFRKSSANAATSVIPGLCSLFPNQYFEALKEAPWPQVLQLLGKSGERIMIDLLVDCAIFVPLEAGVNNFYQLSGVPLSELQTLSTRNDSVESSVDRKTTDISFVRNRMLYARAALNARGMVQFGLRHIHVLNRCSRKAQAPDRENSTKDLLAKNNAEETKKVMMYIFPRQFGLHNAFTSEIDYKKTAQKFQDYTLREEEIRSWKSASSNERIKLPKRLRGRVQELVERMQVLHGRCAYTELLRHYCPTQLNDLLPDATRKQPIASSRSTTCASRTLPAQSQKPSSSKSSARRSSQKHKDSCIQASQASPKAQFDCITDLATPASHVSAFCQAVLSNIIPNDFWGPDGRASYNRALILNKVDHFVKLRRFEHMSLYEVVDGLKVTEMTWLSPPGLEGQKTSQSDMAKRLEILNEFVYYIFDSLLIPLIRSNFYVTESSTFRYRMFFFRHDVWRHVADPATSAVKASMFEEVKFDDAMRILDSRQLGFSQVRLLPKGTTMRPIMNLRRRTAMMGNKRLLGPSINSLLSPIHSVLKLERSLDSSKLGASLFSVSEIYQRIKSFRGQLASAENRKFYFAKVDIKSAFDTIPQDGIIRLMSEIASQKQYKLLKHAEVKRGFSAGSQQPSRRWQTVAVKADDTKRFSERLEHELATAKRQTVFVGNSLQRRQDRRTLLALMDTHIRQNLVKIGKKYYRQSNGIPQGSVLSATLCNYFYADLESKHLGFLSCDDCLLLRLIDDFLLITTHETKAKRFIDIMHGGFPEYGATVQIPKTLVNFDHAIQGTPIPRIARSSKFPYCGTVIDCKTLDVSRNLDHSKDPTTSNGLTVEFSRSSGRNFQRKTLSAFKIQSHIMFFDTNHNSPKTVSRNLFEAFAETTSKMWAYMRCLPAKKKPSSGLVIDTIAKLSDTAFMLLTSRTRKVKHPGYACTLTKVQVTWLALNAVRSVLLKKQADYEEVLGWVAQEITRLGAKKGIRSVHMMYQVVDA